MEQDIEGSAGKVGPAHGPDKKGVAGKKVFLPVETHASGCMAGGVKHLQKLISELDSVPIPDLQIGGRGWPESHLAGHEFGAGQVEEFGIGLVHDDTGARAIRQDLVAAGVIGMAVGIDDVQGPQIDLVQAPEDDFFASGRIDQDPFPGLFTSHDIAKDGHGADEQLFNNHIVPKEKSPVSIVG
jgi:hypothetical protein